MSLLYRITKYLLNTPEKSIYEICQQCGESKTGVEQRILYEDTHEKRGLRSCEACYQNTVLELELWDDYYR